MNGDKKSTFLKRKVEMKMMAAENLTSVNEHLNK